MDATGHRPWPPTPEEAPGSEDVLETLTDLLIQGSRRYRDTEPQSDLLDRLRQRLDGVDLELLTAYEAHTNHLAALWAEDRFRVGFALGASAGRLFSG